MNPDKVDIPLSDLKHKNEYDFLYQINKHVSENENLQDQTDIESPYENLNVDCKYFSEQEFFDNFSDNHISKLEHSEFIL